jgi:nicotinamidase/pyrazinamidase
VHPYDARTALIVVDVQNDFADPAGSLYVTGGEQVVDAVNAEIERAVPAGALLVYTQDWHPPATPHFEKDGGIWPVHCVAGSWGADFHPRLKLVEGAVNIRKGRRGEDGYSGFSVRDPVTGATDATELESDLRRRGIQRAVVVGLATDYCVKATAADAAAKGFSTTVLTKATAAVDVDAGDGDRALLELRKGGVSVE